MSFMLSQILRAPFPQHNLFPIGCRAILHNHWGCSSRLKRVFYLHRDGRDVAVSSYFHYVRNALYSNNITQRNIHLKKIGKLFEKHDEQEMLNSSKYMSRFLELWTKSDFNSSYGRNWAEHVSEWLSGSDNVAFISYESLLERPIDALFPALQKHADMDVTAEDIEDAVRRHSFHKMSKRDKGQEDQKSFLRKGISGDWVNHFDRESCEIFDHYCGDTLIGIGYEGDRGWIKKVSN